MKTKKLLFATLASAMLALAAGALLIPGAWADGLPGGGELPTMYYSGFVEDDAGPVEGSPVIRVSLWTAGEPGTGTELCATGSSPVRVTRGSFRIGLPSGCVRAVQENPNVWTEVRIGTDLPLPRQHLGAVPYAVEAGNGVPPGTIAPFGGETPPPGWAVCNGDVVSGAAGTPYFRLYRAIGETWGDGGDGTGTMFDLPDLRGQFLRGAHGASVDSDGDRSVGSGQDDAMQGHGHREGGHSHNLPDFCYHYPFQTGGFIGGLMNNSCSTNTSVAVVTVGDPIATGSGVPRIASETRPANLAVLYIIKL